MKTEHMLYKEVSSLSSRGELRRRNKVDILKEALNYFIYVGVTSRMVVKQ